MELFSFKSLDGYNLDGILYKSQVQSSSVILSLHGMGSNCFKDRETSISKEANKRNIDYYCFNNRGSDLARYIRKIENGKKKKELGGTSFEDVLDSYQDIVGALIELKNKGYKNIYLQGHSLGSTKIVYTFNKLKEEKSDLLNNIKGIILLSLIDIPLATKVYLRENFDEYVNLAQTKYDEGKEKELMPHGAFIHPISVKTFLRYTKNNQEIDFAQYGRDTKMEKLNNIDVPLFMRWGNENEMILQKADELVKDMNNIIKNDRKDINYIDGANHSYSGKEDILAKEILDFVESCMNNL